MAPALSPSRPSISVHLHKAEILFKMLLSWMPRDLTSQAIMQNELPSPPPTPSLMLETLNLSKTLNLFLTTRKKKKKKKKKKKEASMSHSNEKEKHCEKCSNHLLNYQH
jgi:hypothetical protein